MIVQKKLKKQLRIILAVFIFIQLFSINDYFIFIVNFNAQMLTAWIV